VLSNRHRLFELSAHVCMISRRPDRDIREYARPIAGNPLNPETQREDRRRGAEPQWR